MVYKTRKYGLIQELPSTPDRKTGSLVKSVGLDSEDYFSDELEFLLSWMGLPACW